MKRELFLVVIAIFFLLFSSCIPRSEELIIKRSEHPELFSRIMSGQGATKQWSHVVGDWHNVYFQYVIDGQEVDFIGHLPLGKEEKPVFGSWFIARSYDRKVIKKKAPDMAYSDGVLLKSDEKEVKYFPPITFERLSIFFKVN